jgi:tetratricopeptide (TPR) repeat protein
VIYLGQTKLAMKDYEAANKYFEEALKVENKLTAIDRTMLIARRYNAKALMGLKKEPEAEKLLQENLQRLKTATANPDEWKLTREVLASLYEKQGKTSEAAELKT